MQFDTINFANYPIKPQHIDIGDGIVGLFGPLGDALATAIILYQQNNPSATKQGRYCLVFPDELTRFMRARNARLESFTVTSGDLDELVARGLLERKPMFQTMQYLPTSEMIAKIFAKYPNDDVIHSDTVTADPPLDSVQSLACT